MYCIRINFIPYDMCPHYPQLPQPYTNVLGCAFYFLLLALLHTLDDGLFSGAMWRAPRPDEVTVSLPSAPQSEPNHNLSLLSLWN